MTSKIKTPAILKGEEAARPLMLHCARLLLYWLEGIDNERGRMDEAGTWRDADSAVDLAVTHAADCVRGWVADLPERDEFERQWWRLSGVMTLAAQAFTNKDTAYQRMLNGADQGMQSLPEVWQTVAEGLPHRTRRAHRQPTH